MKKYTISQFLIILVSFLGLSSCSDYLSVEDGFSASDSKDYILTDAAQSRRFQRSIYLSMPNYSDYAAASSGGLGNPWASMSDELSNNANGTLQNIGVQGYTSFSAGSHRWQALYKTIRTASIYISDAKTIGKVGDPDYLSDAELKSLKAECYFMRAYSYYLLLEQYGPVPVLEEIASASDPNSDYERNSVDEVVSAIEKDLSIAITDLDPTRISTTVASGFEESRLAIPTIGVALAVRAKLLVLVASPLYNGGYDEGMALTNHDGKKLFPQSYDAGKWVKAKNALKDFITYADAGNYQLYKSASNDPDLNIYELFQKYNKEIIWGNPVQSWGTVETAQTPRDISVVAGGSNGSTLGVTQEMVDAFFMKNGLAINDAGSTYVATGFTNVLNPATRFVKSGTTVYMTDANVLKAYANREPRFYAAITYQGKSWHDVVSNTSLQGTTPATSKVTKVLFARDIPSSKAPAALPGFGGIANNDNRLGGFPKTGYLCYKNCNRTIHPTVASGIRSVFRPSIIFRLADFYLLYAEVANEVDPSDPDIVKYLDLVRVRAGISGYVTMQSSGAKTGVIGNKNAMRKAIVAERRVELFTEGQRYFDVRRWMIADKPEGMQGGLFTGMNMDGNASDLTFFQKINIDNAPRKFDRAMYLYPIQLSEVTNSRKLVQNPGW
jgi:hypothetical protein